MGVAATSTVSTVASAALAGIATNLGWFYILAATFFLAFVLFLLVSRYGGIRLGPDNSRPEFRTLPWFAMLFTAGMGIGLVFYGVNEPAYHAANAPGTAGGPQQAAVVGMGYTLFHWGLHPWAIYIVLGLALGYFAFRRGLPLRPAAALYPLIGDRIYGWPGNLIDILAVFGTLFGLATSLGLGTLQINAGLASVFGLPNNTTTNLLIIAAITAIAVTSVMLGIDKGIRRLSVINLWLAVILMMFVFIVGPKIYILSGLADYTGYYLQNLPRLSFSVFNPNTQQEAASWQATWTLFYWGWWISWSPFVGMFIARISYGRTIRQFIGGTLFAPVGASIVWFSVFGGSGLFYQLYGNANISGSDAQYAMYILLDQLPVGGIVAAAFSLLTVAVVTLFFATSSDSGSLVVDMLTNGGDPHPNRGQRFFWAVTEGAVTGVLLVVGGRTAVEALQAASVTAGLPFAVVLLLVAAGTLRGLREDRVPPATVGPPPGREAPVPQRVGGDPAPAGRTSANPHPRTSET